MKNFIKFVLLVIFAFALFSCTKVPGPGYDPIRVSTKSATFASTSDSVTLFMGGSWWWIDKVGVNSVWYNVDSRYRQFPNYFLKEGPVSLERRGYNVLFVKADANQGNTKRIIRVVLKDGSFSDVVTIKQLAK